MPKYAITFIFSLQRHGFTETWWKNTDSQTLDNLFDDAKVVAEQRMKLAGKQTELQAIRISNGDDPGRVGKTYYNPLLGNQNLDSAASNVALNCQFATVDNAYQKLVQIRGFPDDWETGGGAPFNGDGALQAAFDSYRNAILLKQFGWRSINARQRFRITGYTTTAQGIVKLAVEEPTAPVGGIGTQKPVRISGLNVKSVLNGEQVVIVTGANEFTVLKPIAVGPFVSQGSLVVPSYTVRVAANGTIQRIGKRQAGAPLLQSRGRGRVRQRI